MSSERAQLHRRREAPVRLDADTAFDGVVLWSKPSMPPTLAVTIGSNELNLAPGTLAQLDDVVCRFGRERIVLRIVSILNVLSLGKAAGLEKGQIPRSLSEDYLQVLPEESREALASALRIPNAIFFEPWQQLFVLKRALIVSPVDCEGLDFMTVDGETAFFDVCRYAADLVIPDREDGVDDSTDRATAWLKVAAGMMPRPWMLNPPNPAIAMARFRVMFERIPLEDDDIAERVKALDHNF